jgi:hypothetical protein
MSVSEKRLEKPAVITKNAMLISHAECNLFGHLQQLASLEVRSGLNVSQISIVKLATFAGNFLSQKKRSV